MSVRKVEAESTAGLLGKAEVNWKIADWSGSLAHLMRSKAECFVNVPFEDSTDDHIKLRFHLKPNKSYVEPHQKFCEQRKEFVHVSLHCSCNSCKDVSNMNTVGIPEEFVPEIPTRSSGYSLLVDVVEGPENLALMVSESGERWCGPRNNLVILDNESGRVNLLVDVNFLPLMKWTKGKDGQKENVTRELVDNVKDARLQLTVSAYEVTTSGTDAPELKNVVDTATVAEKPALNDHVENPVYENSDVILRTEDGIDIHAQKSILSAKSEYFRESLTESTTTLSVPLDSDLLICFLHWMYKGQWTSNYYLSLDEICDTALGILKISPEFWRWLDGNLERFFVLEKLSDFLNIAKQYNLKPSARLLKDIEFLQKNVSGEFGYQNEYEHELRRKWDFSGVLKEEVNYLKIVNSKDVPEDSLMENAETGATNEPTTTTVSISFETSMPRNSDKGTSSQESDTDLSFNLAGKQNDNTSESESDEDSSLESFCEVVEGNNVVELDSREEIKKLRKEMAKLLKRFKRLKHSE